ncbi:uncharacterized protein HaLaN_25061 [Haematococcus lacustris]|uniref:RNB domain-containing protein n=1 Tax=Haematococcus lacustris TaxID=44745 RepID=A0A6A0A4Y9_HAELA|nr:uncharacterized protein HaLaN_25061 [Haematococcus lacustris]
MSRRGWLHSQQGGGGQAKGGEGAESSLQQRRASVWGANGYPLLTLRNRGKREFEWDVGVGCCGWLQGIMADPPLAQQLTDSLRAMNSLAKLLRRRRSERGALQLASPEVKFKIDSATQEATDVGMYQPDSPYPAGHYVRTLGVIGDKETETEVLLIEHDINTSPFTPAVHDCVPPLPWCVGPEHESDPNRTDLRSLCICSVDPPGCKDIDDALHVRPLPNGNYEVGVHIADVTHFLRPGTAMDLEAMQRATTTYLVQRRIDMLPKPLTEDICSLSQPAQGSGGGGAGHEPHGGGADAAGQRGRG